MSPVLEPNRLKTVWIKFLNTSYRHQDTLSSLLAGQKRKWRQRKREQR